MATQETFFNSLYTRGILSETGREEFEIKEPLKKKYLLISYLPDDPFEVEKVQTMAILYADKIGAKFITDRHSVEDSKNSLIISMDMLSLYDNAIVWLILP